MLWFTTDKSHWMNHGISSRKLRSMRANEDGTFKVRGIPAGEYFLSRAAGRRDGRLAESQPARNDFPARDSREHRGR